MSGHSHAKTIKHQKDITDRKRGQVFSKMARVISIAVKEGGPDPEVNTKLRLAFETAKKFNMPKENVENAIKRAMGGEGEEQLAEVVFEAYGPGGVAILVEGITDNKNRTLGEIKQILNQNNGKLVGEGAIRWMFDRKGVITIDLKSQTDNLKSKEGLEMAAIDAGAEDIRWYEDSLDIYTKPENFEKIKKDLENGGFKIESASIGWLAKEEVSLGDKEKESCNKLFDALDENDAVQNTYSNLKD